MFDSTLDQDIELARKHCLGRLTESGFEHFVGQQAMQCTDAKPIHCRMLLRQLVIVSTVLGNQRLVYIVHRESMA